MAKNLWTKEELQVLEQQIMDEGKGRLQKGRVEAMYKAFEAWLEQMGKPHRTLRSYQLQFGKMRRQVVEVKAVEKGEVVHSRKKLVKLVKLPTALIALRRQIRDVSQMVAALDKHVLAFAEEYASNIGLLRELRDVREAVEKFQKGKR